MTQIDINPFPLGAIAPTSGTPLNVLTNFSDLVSSHAKALTIYGPASNTGKVYVGRSTMNRSTLAGVLAVVGAGEIRTIPFNYQGGNNLDLTKFYIDVDTTGDQGLVVALFA